MKTLDARVVAAVIMEEPLLGHFLINSRVIVDPNVPEYTWLSIIDGQVRLSINPDLFYRCQPSVQIGLLLREYLHTLLLHCRQMTIFDAEESKLVSLAQELAINPVILKTYGLPEKTRLPKHYGLPEFKSYEFYLIELTKKPSLANDYHKRSLSQDGNANAVLETLTESWIQTSSDDAGSDGRISRAVGGKDLARQLMTASTGNVDWRSKLREFCNVSLNSRQVVRYSRPSRRLGFPFPNKSFESQPYIPIILDTSSSMAGRLQTGINEVMELVSVGTVKLFQCSEKLTSVAELDRNDSIEVIGFGGTDLQPAFDACWKDQCRHVLVISDREFSVEPKTYDLQVTWLIIDDKGVRLECN